MMIGLVNQLTRRLRIAVTLTFLATIGAGCALRAEFESNVSIYDSAADGTVQLHEALLKAQESGRRVLLNFGADWCSDSRKMYRLLREHQRVSKVVRSHYVLAMVDADNRTGVRRNADLAERYGNPFEKGIPVLLVLDSDGRLLNTDASERLADSDHKRPRKVLRYLTRWAAEPH